jgi:cytochrome P450
MLSANLSYADRMSIATAENLGAIFVDPAAYADPVAWHATAQRIREESPILDVQVEGYPKFWAITTHADVMEVERHPEVFTNAPYPTVTPSSHVDAATNVPVKTLIQMDGDQHKAHRNLVNDWFKPVSVKNLQERIDTLARRSVDRMADMGGRCDFANDVAVNFPLHVILAILGLPEGDYPRMLMLTQELFGAEDPDIARLAEDESQFGVLVEFMNYFTALTADRRDRPTGDLASVIANAEIGGKPLPDMDTLGHYLIIATAGHDTTSSVIAGGLLALLDNPDQLALLQGDPTLMHAAADELIRFVSPVKHFMRTCQKPFTVGGVTFEPGDHLLLSFASANRDETVFTEADRLNVRRENAASQLAFGFGRHFCLGAHLARMEIRAIFKELLARVEHIALDGDPTWVRANFVQGPKSIPISYGLR